MTNYQNDTKEQLLIDKKYKKWRESEYACYETPLFSILPAFLFWLRKKLLSWLHFTVFRIFGIEFTIGGLFFVLSLSSIIAYVEYTYFGEKNKGSITGRLNGYIACLIFTFSSRNSIWAFLTGASWDRTLIIHKSLILFLATSIGFHLVYNFRAILIRTSGIYMVSALTFILITANYLLRRYAYWFFYICHLIGISALIYNANKHGVKMLINGVYIWLFDVAIRLLVIIVNWRRLSSAEITLKKNVVQITIKKRCFQYRPGQYAFLWIPSVSFWQVHPFTISSSPGKDSITFHIKKVGPWTKKLHEIANSRTNIFIGLQGAYGTSAIDIDSPSYDNFVFISGGIGVTPMLSIANSLCDQYKRGRKINHIDFVWSVKELDLFTDVMDNAKDNLFTAVKPVQGDEKINCDENLVNVDLYVTKEKDNDELTKKLNSIPNLNIYNGRCNFVKLFTEIKCRFESDKRQRVVVMVCGPAEMIDVVYKLSRSESDKNITFEFCSETFEL